MVITLGQQYNVGENPPSYCTLTLIAMQGRQQKGRQTNTSSNNKDKPNTIIETSTAEDHDDENLHNPSTRPRYSPESRRRAVGVLCGLPCVFLVILYLLFAAYDPT